MKRPLYIITALIIFSLSACNSTDRSDYEKASGIDIPGNAKQQESYDDGKLVKTSVFVVDNAALNRLISAQQFRPFKNENIPQFWGVTYIKEKPDFNNMDALYFKSGTGEKVSWIYIADVKSGRLWTEIKYQGKPLY